MMARTFYMTLSCLLAFSTPGLSQEKLHTTKIDNFSQLQQHFQYQDDKPVIISGHRGGMLPGYPKTASRRWKEHSARCRPF